MTSSIKTNLLSGAAAVALMFTPYLVPAQADAGKAIQLAQGHSGGGHGAGSQRGGGGGHAGGGHSSSSSGGALSKGGPSAESDGRGPRNQPGSGTRGKPVWAQEGIPEVELGRLNVVRSPGTVLNRQLAEAIKTWNPTLAEPVSATVPSVTTISQLYSLSSAQFITYLKSVTFKDVTLIDSPLQNLALLKDLLSDGTISLTGVTPYSTNDLAAILIGVASDKTVPISTDTVVAITKILGVSVSDPAAVAAAAEAVRLAVLEAHG
jgi:hypothetical protein